MYKQQFILCLKLSILLLNLELTNSNVGQGQKMEQNVKDIVYLRNYKLVLFCVLCGRLRWRWADITWWKPIVLKEMYCVLYRVIFSLPMDFISIQDFYSFFSFLFNWASFSFMEWKEYKQKYIPIVMRTVISVRYQSVAGSVLFLSTGPNTSLV